MAAHHPVVCGRRLSIILLLVVAYFGISTFDNSGRLPERREKLKLNWRQGSRSSAEEERKSAHARALDPVAGAITRRRQIERPMICGSRLSASMQL